MKTIELKITTKENIFKEIFYTNKTVSEILNKVEKYWKVDEAYEKIEISKIS